MYDVRMMPGNSNYGLERACVSLCGVCLVPYKSSVDAVM
jgi:hypothetical protein